MKNILKKNLAFSITVIVVTVTVLGIVANYADNNKIVNTDYYNRCFSLATFKNGKVALINKQSGTICSPKVDKISDSGEDSLTIFVSNMKYGYLNSKTGVIAIKAVFNYAWDFDYQSGLAAVVQNDQIGFIDCFGKYAITPQYKYDELNCHEDIMFSGGYCLIPDGKGRIGVINTDNQIVLPAIYSRIEKTFFGYSILVINEKFGLADSCFQIMIKPEHDYIALNHQGIVISDYRADKQYMLAYDYKTVITQYVFDNIEKIIIDTKQYDEDEENECLSYKHSGYSKFTINGKCGVIHDKSGTIIISAKWDDIQYHDVGVFLSVLDGCYFLINIKGEIIN